MSEKVLDRGDDGQPKGETQKTNTGRKTQIVTVPI